MLKGAKAADLPVQELTNFKLIVNLKATKALPLKIPLLLVTRTDRVIE